MALETICLLLDLPPLLLAVKHSGRFVLHHYPLAQGFSLEPPTTLVVLISPPFLQMKKQKLREVRGTF